MDIRQLRYFIAVAEHLSFTEAANRLFVVQSAVSQQIAELEKRLEVKLFERTKRSVQLTSAGRVFLREATLLLQKSEEAIELARQAESGVLGSLNIGFLGLSLKQYLPRLIRQFRLDYPQITLKVNRFSHGLLNESLGNGELDLAFTSSFGLQSIPDLEWKSVYSDSSTIVIHQDHPLASRSKVNLAELAHEPFIALNRQDSPQAYDRLLQLCANNGFSPNIVSQTGFIDTVLLLVEAGMGIAIMPRGIQSYASPELRFLEIEGYDSQFDLVVAWKKTNPNPSIPFFLDAIEAVKN